MSEWKEKLNENMRYCIECGAEISEHQATHFYGRCPECVRISRMEPIKQNGSQNSSCYKWWIYIILIPILLMMFVFMFFAFR